MSIDMSALEVDLGALDAPAAATPSPTPNGKPLRILLADIEEDPNQPRKEFGQDRMAELVASIRVAGVKSPVSVRPHPSKPGKFILNHGARRYRASVEAGTGDIPAFIDEQHTDYDQVIENIQRENLTTREFAMFVHRKITEDREKKQVVAKRLGISGDIITYHLALIDPPAVVDDAYTTGKCSSARTLYDLRALAEKFPDAVQEWYEADPEVTRTTVDALAATLKGAKKGAGKNFDASKLDGAGGRGGQSQIEAPDDSRGRKRSGVGQVEGGGSLLGNDPDNGHVTSWPEHVGGTGPTPIKRPLLLVEHEGRGAAILLNLRPDADGLVWIRYEDNGGDDQVAAGSLKINRLMEE